LYVTLSYLTRPSLGKSETLDYVLKSNARVLELLCAQCAVKQFITTSIGILKLAIEISEYSYIFLYYDLEYCFDVIN